MYEWEGLKYNLSKVEYWREPLEDIRELVTRMMHQRINGSTEEVNRYDGGNLMTDKQVTEHRQNLELKRNKNKYGQAPNEKEIDTTVEIQ